MPRDIVQNEDNKTIGYWAGNANFVELANFAVEFVQHVSLPKSVTQHYPDYASGFIAKVMQVIGDKIIERYTTTYKLGTISAIQLSCWLYARLHSSAGYYLTCTR
jgi:hypothetical protein